MDPTESQDDLYRRAAEQYGAALTRLARAYEADPELRRDLEQEMHLALWRSLVKFNGGCSLRTWIFRVAHNVATSHVIREVRGKRLVPAFLTLDEAEAQASNEDVEHAADRTQVLEHLFALIQQLAPLDRQVIMGYLDDLDAESISDITGLSVENVWSKTHRIKKLLIRRFSQGVSHAV